MPYPRSLQTDDICMSLGLDILQAVKLGGYERWRPACELEQKRKSPPMPKKLETELDAMFKALGNDQLSSSQWADRMGWRVDLIRHRANILIRRNMVKRTTGLMPFRYFKG